MASDLPSPESRSFRTVAYGLDPSQYVEVWPAIRPTGRTSRPPVGTALLIHGGYWRDRYGLDLMHPMARHLVEGGWRVVNIEYRRLAESETGIWAEMSADVLAAVNADPDPVGPVVAIGHSAGGQLALWAAAGNRRQGPGSVPADTGLDIATDTGNGPGGNTAAGSGIDAVVALAPVADLVEADRLDLSDGAVRLLLGADSESEPELYRRASPRALVPLGLPQLVVHGSADDNVPQEISLDYAATATAAGDPVDLITPDGVDHFHIIDPAHEVWRAVDRWLGAIPGTAGRDR